MLVNVVRYSGLVVEYWTRHRCKNIDVKIKITFKNMFYIR